MFAVLAAAAILTAPQGFYEARVLEPAASFVAAKPATIYCALADSSWSDYTSPRTGNINGLTTPGSSETFLSPTVCRWLRQRLAKHAPPTAQLAASALTLVHESIHQRGVADEGQTECAAMHELPRVAVKFFRITAGRQLRAVMDAAWRYHRATPPAFQTVC